MLTDLAIRAAKPRSKPYKLFDARGLFVFVTPTGTRVWRLKYRHQDKEKVSVIGRYPTLSLKEARVQRDAAPELLDAGVDPSAARREQAPARAVILGKTARTFEPVAREWWADRKKSERWDEDYVLQVLSQLERDVFPVMLTRGLPLQERGAHPLLSKPVGKWPLAALMPPDVLEICRNVEARVAHWMRPVTCGRGSAWCMSGRRCSGAVW